MRFSSAQKQVIKNLQNGVDYASNINKDGNICYRKADAKRNDLYLTLTMRSLFKRGYIKHNYDFTECYITQRGIDLKL